MARLVPFCNNAKTHAIQVEFYSYDGIIKEAQITGVVGFPMGGTDGKWQYGPLQAWESFPSTSVEDVLEWVRLGNEIGKVLEEKGFEVRY